MRVKGSVEGYLLSQYKLMPRGSGTMFLPIEDAIRKKTKKKAGDWAHIILRSEDSPVEIPQELGLFWDGPQRLCEAFLGLSRGATKSGKSSNTSVTRI